MSVRVLAVNEPYASMIFDSTHPKTIELRAQPIRQLGRVWIRPTFRKRGEIPKLIGSVEIYECVETTVEEMKAAQSEHRVPIEDIAKYRAKTTQGRLFAWKLRNADKLPQPKPFTLKQGAVNWETVEFDADGNSVVKK
jgi:hypothetical protein